MQANLHASALLLLAFLFAAPASGQVTLFEDDFSSGLSNWNAFSPWYLAPAGDPCVQSSAPPGGYGAMARMGDVGSFGPCGFNSIASSASMRLAQPVSIPAHADQPTLSYSSYTDSELCNGWDEHRVYISTDKGSSYELLYEDCTFDRVWHEVEIDLSQYAGQEILLSFFFDAVDFGFNDGLGWLVDNIKIETAACTDYNFCVASPNSSSSTGARMGFVGSKRIHSNNFTLSMDDAPPGQFAHFFYGPFEGQIPVASGVLCVGADSFGFRRLYPGGQIDPSGRLEFPLDFPSLLNQYTILPGQSLKFQCWFRDQMGGQSTSNFSDGLSVTFCE